ncbi:hypothetical protein [Geobacter sp. AOG1]|uniref:hypothetical protein n=1 Tax=Geobacter sp. AOG1 TaxID=1566346 RepID=UPI001CC63870|nr:hypothetical protein [Geobacter sp. AOG1]GFE57896.1 hypothetical protein AOG1_17760 [Geobacter sp. AOG1]
MINILLITTDQRAMAIVELLKPQHQLRVDVVSDFDQGMKDIFDKRPQMVFIQGEIDGVSGETVARHIKGLLREQSPRLILLRETLQARVGAKSCYDGSIDLFLDEDDLLNAFRTQMETISGFRWQPPVPVGGPDVPVMSTADQYAAALAAATLESRPEPQDSLATEPLTPLSHRGQPLSPPAPPAEPVYNVEMRSPEPISAAGGIQKPGEFRGTPPPFENTFYGHKTKHRPWRYVIVFLAVLAVCATVYLYQFSQPRNAPASRTGGPVSVPSPAGQQPSASSDPARTIAFISRNRPDVGYAAAHPGWERFTNDAMEFLVFRESGNVKAIQIVALRQESLSDAFVAERVQDVSGSSAYQIGSRIEKDGFLIEKGSAKGNVELVIYRKRPSGDIRALVIALP